MKKIGHNIFTHKKIITIFIIAIFFPSLILIYLSYNTFSQRRETTKNILESNLWISGDAALNALENTIMPALIARLNRKEAMEKAREILIKVGLEKRLKHRIGELSGGEQQRVAIARALVTDPSLIIADESTANLDTETSRKILGLMRDLNNREDTTFIFSTHDQRLLDQVERLIPMEDGEILEGGSER